MLDRTKIGQELSRVSLRLFQEHTSLSWFTVRLWQSITTNEQFLQQVLRAQLTHKLPRWQGSLDAITSHQPLRQPYAVVAADGSQIYPDHHLQGIDCFLVNTGVALFSYDTVSKATLTSDPVLYTSGDTLTRYGQPFVTPELVDLIREDHEFAALVRHGQQLSVAGKAAIALFDGNLLFWHLENKFQQVKETFTTCYMQHLEALYQQRMVYAGYLSSSRFTDLVALMKQGLCDGEVACGLDGRALYSLCTALETLTDAHLLQHILQPGQRTTVFASAAAMVDDYPEHSRPHFFYLNTGAEIVRIEIPAWVAADVAALELVCGVSLDQCDKGQGYPVSLAEAHAQAVVSTSDRDFFYQLVFLQGVKQSQRVQFSQKSLKKKILNV